jgi:hypothetical protein
MSRLAAFLVVVGCAPSPAPTAGPPAAPVIRLPEQPSGEPWRAVAVTLRVETEDQTVVRLFASPDCSGSELLRVSSDEAREGFTLDTVNGDNVFSAEAVFRRGDRSPCSAAVTLEVRLILRSMQVVAPFISQVLPPTPTREPVVRLKGSASARSTVSVWEGPTCSGTRLAQGSGQAFRDEGLAVALTPDRTLTVSLDAQEGDWLSACVERLDLVNDQTPPDVSKAFLFPRPPSAARVGVVVVPDVEGRLVLSPGRACGLPLGAPLSTFCRGSTACDGYLSPVVFPVTPVVSVQARDPVGNQSACVTLEHTPSTDPAPAFYAAFHTSTAGTSLLLAPGSNPEIPAVFLSQQCGFETRPATHRLLEPGGSTAVAVYGDLPAAGSVSIGWWRLTEIVDCQRLR